MLLTATAFGLGALHGLGGDHLMAIATLAVRPGADRSPRAPVRVALQFAVGHALLLLVGAGLVLAVGWQIPAIVERTGEVVGGLLLIGLGAFTLWAAVGRRLYGHAHPHGEPPHMHWHVHLGAPAHHPDPARHSHVAGALGAVFAVSGLRALVLLAPGLQGGAASLAALLYLVAVFAVGILLSMSLFGIVLARVLGAPWVVRTVGAGATAATAVASIALGIYWIVT